MKSAHVSNSEGVFFIAAQIALIPIKCRHSPSTSKLSTEDDLDHGNCLTHLNSIG